MMIHYRRKRTFLHVNPRVRVHRLVDVDSSAPTAPTGSEDQTNLQQLLFMDSPEHRRNSGGGGDLLMADAPPPLRRSSPNTAAAGSAKIVDQRELRRFNVLINITFSELAVHHCYGAFTDCGYVWCTVAH
jgi:hypothetical protein